MNIIYGLCACAALAIAFDLKFNSVKRSASAEDWIVDKFGG